jgi:CheY-like chemotaxis protein
MDAPPGPLRRRILVVDDNPLGLRLIRMLLEKEGYSVSSAETGTAGLAELGEKIFDLVICDHNLPDMKGQELALAIEDTVPKVRFILISGDEASATDATFDAFILKPFRTADLIGTVREVLLRPPAN